MVVNESIILRSADRLSHAEASRLAELAEKCRAQSVVLDLSRCLEATTPAFARLVLLRRHLLQGGRDLRLAGLRGQPAKLLEVHRLDTVLPRISQVPREAQKPVVRPSPTVNDYADLSGAESSAVLCV